MDVWEVFLIYLLSPCGTEAHPPGAPLSSFTDPLAVTRLHLCAGLSSPIPQNGKAVKGKDCL